VGNPVEFVECLYQDINPSKSINPIVKSFSTKTKNNYVEYLTISKGVLIFYLNFTDCYALFK